MYAIQSHELVFRENLPWWREGGLWFLNDGEKIKITEKERIAGVKEHLAAGDYFASLATVLDLTSQSLKKVAASKSARLGKLKKDLLYLQKNYRIVEK